MGSIALSPAEDKLVSTSKDQTVKILDLSILKIKESYPLSEPASAVSFFPSTQTFAVGTTNGSIFVLGAEKMKETMTFEKIHKGNNSDYLLCEKSHHIYAD